MAEKIEYMRHVQGPAIYQQRVKRNGKKERIGMHVMVVALHNNGDATILMPNGEQRVVSQKYLHRE